MAAVAAAISLGLAMAIAPTPAGAAGDEYWTYSCEDPTPYDAGGCDAGGSLSTSTYADEVSAHFNAYDETLIINNSLKSGETNAVVQVRYYSSNGRTYYWTYETQRGENREIQLGGDDDLAENNHIDVKICRGNTSSCTGWAWGVT